MIILSKSANYQQVSKNFFCTCLAKAKKQKGKGKDKSKSAFDKELTNTSQKALKKLRTGYVLLPQVFEKLKVKSFTPSTQN